MATFNLFISGGFSDNAPRYDKMVDPNYQIIQLDVTQSYSITANNRVTNFPVESRSNISDHIFSDNIKISFDATIGLAETQYSAYGNMIKGNKDNPIKANRPQQAYDLLMKVRNEKTLIDVLTEQELFEGVTITDLSVNKTSGDDQLSFSITLEKPRFVTVGKTVLATIKTNDKSTNNKASAKKSDGAKNSGDTDQAEKKVKKAIDAGSSLGDWWNSVVHESGGAEEVEVLTDQ